MRTVREDVEPRDVWVQTFDEAASLTGCGMTGIGRQDVYLDYVDSLRRRRSPDQPVPSG